MIRVKIENRTGHRFDARFPGKIVEIPAHAYDDNAIFTDLPELPVVENWLNDLSTRYRALSWSFVESVEGDVSPDTEPDVEPEKAEEIPVQEEIEEDPFEAFESSVINVTEGGGGWWTVDVKNIGPIKVRGCENKDDAILEAYARQMEG